MKKPSDLEKGGPGKFIAGIKDQVFGVLEGWDRMRLRGTLPKLYRASVMEAYLCAQRIRFSNFGKWAEKATDHLKEGAEGFARRCGRRIVYLNGTKSGRSKEDQARDIAKEEGIESGLIVVFKSIEPCRSYSLRRKRLEEGFEFRLEVRKCLHFYFYFQHPIFGFMHLRLQSWVPFQVDVCINGRHWLGRQLDQAGLGYQKRQNAIIWVEDPTKAQALLDAQGKTDFRGELTRLLHQCCPYTKELSRPLNQEYFWSITESEFATDLLFKKPEDLARIYPSLIYHGIHSFSSPDVMRFLGHNVPATGRVNGKFKGEVISDIKHRPEGVRIKHSVDGNTIKLYDKQASVMRVETTVNNPRVFKVYRKPQGHTKAKRDWRPLRRNVSDIQRRAEVSRASNHRYLEAMSATCNVVPLWEWTRQVCRRIRRKHRSYRGLNPLAETDGTLLQTVMRGEFAISGFRNRQIRPLLFPNASSRRERNRQAAAVSRKLLLLRAHGLVAKVSRTHRYILTDKGRHTIIALLSARNADVAMLTKLAA